jgi:hypothetical protein
LTQRRTNALGSWQVRQSDRDRLYDREWVQLRLSGDQIELRRPSGELRWIGQVFLDDVSVSQADEISFRLKPDGEVVRLGASSSMAALLVPRLRAEIDRVRSSNAAALRTNSNIDNSSGATADVTERLKRIKDLREQGLLTDAEYAMKRDQIIEGL